MAALRTPPSRCRAAAAALCIAAAALSGCGGSSSHGATADPAGVVPAAAPVYAEARVRPTGQLQANARAVGQTLAREANPYRRLLGALQTPGSPPLDYTRDVAPWLGERAAVFLQSYSPAAESQLLGLLRASLPGASGTPAGFPFAAGGLPAGAIVLDTRDEKKARAFLDKQASHAGAHATSYRSLSYQSTGVIAFGLVDHFAVIGSEAAMRAVIDVSAGSAALAAAGGYKHLQPLATSGTLGHLYVNGPALAGSARTVRAGDLLALLADSRTVNASLTPGQSELTLDLDSSPAAAPAGLLGAEPEASHALGELPGDSFLAVGFGNAAPALGRFIQAVSLAGISGGSGSTTPGISLRGLSGALLTPLGALTENSTEARRDFQSWMGSGGLFASGSGLLDLKAALVISSRNPALSRAAVAKLGERLRRSGASVSQASILGTDAAISVHLTGLPVALSIANGRGSQGQTKFVIGLGESSVEVALNPQSTFSGSATYSAASAALGEGIQPSLAAQVPTLLALLESLGLTEDPSLAPILPYLRPLDAVYGGGRSLSSDADRFRLHIGLRG